MMFAIPAGTRINDLDAAQRRLLLDRAANVADDVRATVARIILEVREHGDAALRDYAARFDNVQALVMDVPRESWQRALNGLDRDVRDALEFAASNIARFHRAQLPQSLEIEMQPGVLLGRRADALESVAVYAPGGRAAYPSSVLMGVIPARVAGVGEIIVCSPPAESGAPSVLVMAACAIAGADRLFAIGGAGAIAACAYGTATVPRVAKIVGPGNAYVTEAKQQVNGVVAIDSPAGPSEVLVLADESARADLVAAELIAQAEHDPDAACVLATTSARLIDDVAAVIEVRLDSEPRAGIVRAAFRTHGALLLAADTDELVSFHNSYAPEHAAIYLDNARDQFTRLRNAGTAFLGSSASVAFGDYITGANHVLPTAALARSYSGLSTADFMRWTTYQAISPAGARDLAPRTVTLALAEGLPAHARAAQLRGAE